MPFACSFDTPHHSSRSAVSVKRFIKRKFGVKSKCSDVHCLLSDLSIYFAIRSGSKR